MERIKNNEFLEHTQIGEDYYGSGEKDIRKIFEDNRICVMTLDAEGAKRVK